MKRLPYFLALVILITSCEKGPVDIFTEKNSHIPDVLSDGEWERRADYEGTSGAVAGFAIENKGYVVGASSDFWEYDPHTDSWTQKANFGGGSRRDAVAFNIRAKGYLFGGWGEAGLYFLFNDLWEYDPKMNTWIEKANLPGKGRYWTVGFSTSSYGYVATGNVVDTVDKCPVIRPTDELWQYNPLTDVWLKKAPFGGGEREDAAGFSIADKGYLGVGKDLQGAFTNDFWEYDEILDKWNRKADYRGAGRTGAIALGISSLNRGYLGSGFGPKDPYTGRSYYDFWEYNQSLNEWIQRSNPAGMIEMSNTVAFNIGDVGYFGPVKDRQFFKFNPMD